MHSPRPPWSRGVWERHPRVADAAVSLPFALGTLAVLFVGRSPSEIGFERGASSAALVAVVVVAVSLRRSRPTVLLTTCIAAQAVGFALGQPGEYYSAVVLVYSAAARRSTGAGVRVAAVTLAAVVVGIAGARVLPDGTPTALREGAVDVFSWLVVVGIALMLGTIVGNRRRYVAAILERTRQLAEERDRSAALARVAERAHIAREMHDVLSHGLQVIISACDSAVLVSDADPGRARAFMETASSHARRSMSEARLVFAMLDDHRDGADDAVDVQRDACVDVVTTMRSAGLSIALDERGDPGDDPQRALASRRILQESLTNALRHGGHGTHVDVTLEHSAEGTLASIVDDGAGRDSRPPDAGIGIGIAGMRERASVLGGTVAAGPDQTGPGWAVRAWLPRSIAASRRDDEP